MRLNTLYSSIENWFFAPVDARIYALMRIFFGIGALYVLSRWWPVLSIYFSDQGMLGPKVLGPYSLFHYFSSQKEVLFLFYITVGASFALIVGWKSRLAAAILLLWFISVGAAIEGREGPDKLLRLFSFLLLISPINAAWAVDALKHKSSGKVTVPAYGLRLMRWQIVLMLLVVCWNRVGDPFWENGMLTAYLSVSYFSTFYTTLFFEYPWASKFLTYGTIVIEIALPFLLVFRKTRWWGFLLAAPLFGYILVGTRTAGYGLVAFLFLFCYLEDEDISSLVERFQACLKFFKTRVKLTQSFQNRPLEGETK